MCLLVLFFILWFFLWISEKFTIIIIIIFILIIMVMITVIIIIINRLLSKNAGVVLLAGTGEHEATVKIDSRTDEAVEGKSVVSHRVIGKSVPVL